MNIHFWTIRSLISIAFFHHMTVFCPLTKTSPVEKSQLHTLSELHSFFDVTSQVIKPYSAVFPLMLRISYSCRLASSRIIKPILHKAIRAVCKNPTGLKTQVES